MHRLLGLALVSIVAVSSAAYSAVASSAVARPATAVSAFAGPVTVRPRALDVDTSSAGGSLREVRCAAARPGTRCWISINLR